MSRVRVSGGPLLPPETAEVGGSLALAETPDHRCQVRGGWGWGAPTAQA